MSHHFQDRSKRLLMCVVVALVGSQVYGEEKTSPESKASIAPNAYSADTLYLHTEYLPLSKPEQGTLQQCIVRELGRQAILIAARDGLSLHTGDETLGDIVGDARHEISARVRGYRDGSVKIDVWRTKTDQAPAYSESKEKLKYDANSLIPLVAECEKLSADALPKKLIELGANGTASTADEKNSAPNSIDVLLAEMNCVSQFEAVRTAHAAIAKRGQSTAWIEVLARGYANLALLTRHHWKSDSDAFAARALLYGQRLARLNKDDPLAIAHQAYAEALVGLHGAALQQLDRADELHKSASKEIQWPAWYSLLRPYCAFERDALTKIAEQNKSETQLAARLSFEQTLAFGDDRWTYDAARQSILINPEDYSVYASLTARGAPLGVSRFGANSAPAALAQWMPARIAKLSDLPDEVRDAVKPNAEQAEEAAETSSKPPNLSGVLADPSSFSATIPIVKALRSASQHKTDTEPSWSVLGEWLFEEQFVESANLLNTMMNATESSHEAEVKTISAAVEGHRYENFIKSFGVDEHGQQSEFNALVSKIHFVDPRGNMAPMMSRLWYSSDDHKNYYTGSAASWFAFTSCGLVFPELYDSELECADAWWDRLTKAQRERKAEDFRVVSPRSPQALRVTMASSDAPTYEQVKKWETEVGEDPHCFVQLGKCYAALNRMPDAIRCFERSVKLSPSENAFIELATAYRANGQEELWQPTLERFFEGGSLGLEQAHIHDLIANDLMSRGKWNEAESHAVASAQTYSGWGLATAANVYEGLKQYEVSEKYVAEESRNYPSTSGQDWYWWCVRNDQGDVVDAQALAEAFFAKAPSNSDGARFQLAIFDLTKKDAKSALPLLDSMSNTAQTRAEIDCIYNAIFAAVVAHDCKNAEAEKTMISLARHGSDRLAEDESILKPVVALICDVLGGEKATDDAVAKLKTQLASKSVHPRRRCGYSFLLGYALELNGDAKRAKQCYQDAVDLFYVNPSMSALAAMHIREIDKSEPETDSKK